MTNPLPSRRGHPHNEANTRRECNGRRACRICEAEKRRRYQESGRYQVQEAARAAVREALRTATLVKPWVCDDCGAWGRTQAHHTDYGEPLDVAWVCSSCHAKRHWGAVR